MAFINPYLNFEGNSEEAFNFYKSVFGGEFINLTRFKDTPHASEVPEKLKDKIMHVSLPIGENNILMATDATEELGHKLVPGNNISLAIGTNSKEEADRIFNRLSSGGKVIMPLSDAFWGAYFGMLDDKFGIHWMVSFDYQQNQKTEKEEKYSASV